jgi:hypothetical protein
MEIVSMSKYGTDSQQSYFALSCTWGSPNAECTIICNGIPLKVRRNLYLALTQLSTGITEGKFWIDAICIDHTDFEERNQQVAMMGNIYSKAQGVVVWLDPRPRH